MYFIYLVAMLMEKNCVVNYNLPNLYFSFSTRSLALVRVLMASSWVSTLKKKKQALVYILQRFVYIFLCVQYLSFYIACSDRSQKNSTEAMLAVNSLNRYLAVFYFSLQKRNSKNDIWQFASFWLQLWAWEERFKIMSIFTLLNLRIAG